MAKTKLSAANLSSKEWIITMVLSISPLIVHEIIVFIKFLKKKLSKKEND